MSLPNITKRMVHLDELILQLTKPPVTVQFRNQVWLVIQDLEAAAEALEKIAANVVAIKQEFSEYANLKKKNRDAEGDS